MTSGYPAAAIRLFCDRMGVSKSENNIDLSILEDCVRETLGSYHPCQHSAYYTTFVYNTAIYS